MMKNRQEDTPVGFLWIFYKGCSKIEGHMRFSYANLCRSVTNLFDGGRKFDIWVAALRKRSGMGIRLKSALMED